MIFHMHTAGRDIASFAQNENDFAQNWVEEVSKRRLPSCKKSSPFTCQYNLKRQLKFTRKGVCRENVTRPETIRMLKRISCVFHWESSGDWWSYSSTNYKNVLKKCLSRKYDYDFVSICSTFFSREGRLCFVCWTKLNAVENICAWNIVANLLQ